MSARCAFMINDRIIFSLDQQSNNKTKRTHENDRSTTIWFTNMKHINDKYIYCVIFATHVTGYVYVFLCANLSHIIMASNKSNDESMIIFRLCLNWEKNTQWTKYFWLCINWIVVCRTSYGRHVDVYLRTINGITFDAFITIM